MKIRDWIRQAAEYLFFPSIPACVFCGRETGEGEVCAACEKTEQALRLKEESPLESGRRALACFVYEGVIREVFHAYKFQDARYLSGYIAGRMAEAAMAYQADFDAVCYVPLHPKRKRERGYDQVRLLAEGMAERLGMELIHALVRTRCTQKQSSLDAARRVDNVAGAFVPAADAAERLRGKRVLLLDDISATGSTLQACAAALEGAGAEVTATLVFARPR